MPCISYTGSGARWRRAESRGKCGGPGTWISREASRARAGGRAMAQAGCGAGAGGGARCMAVCRRSRPQGLSGWWLREEWVPRAQSGRPGGRRALGKSRACRAHPSPAPAPRPGPWSVAWPQPHPRSLPLHSALRRLPGGSQTHLLIVPVSTSVTPAPHRLAPDLQLTLHSHSLICYPSTSRGSRSSDSLSSNQ